MSTEDAIQQLTERVLINEGHKTVGIFIDLAKAFDTVAHQILLQMLNGVDVTDTELALYSTSYLGISYLGNRTRQVKVNNLIGDYLESI